MALNDEELLRVYCDLHKAFPDDVHIARTLIYMHQQHGNNRRAGDLALAMARRMLAMGWGQDAIGFVELCRTLHHPQTEETRALFALASVTAGEPSALPPEEARTFTLIDQLSDQEALDFFRMSHLRRVRKNDDMVRQGEMEKSCFLILEGAMHVHMMTNKHTHVHLTNLEPGQIFGEFACIYGLPRSATVTAIKPGLALEFSDLGITQLIQRSPMAGEGLIHTIQMRMVQSMSRSHPAMEGIPETDQCWLAEESTMLEFKQEDTLHMDEACFVIMHGSVQASVTCDDEPLSANMGIGAMFGGISAYLRLPPRTVLRATEHCLICRIPGEVFNSFMNAHGGFRAWVKQHALSRIQQWKKSTASPEKF